MHTDCRRTTVVDECLRYATKNKRSVVLHHFYQAREHTAKAFFASLVKQLLAALIDEGTPCPPMVRDEIEFEFGLENRQPDLGELVDNVVVPLVTVFRDVSIILDGPEVCDQREQQDIWKHISRMSESSGARSRFRLAVGSQDHTNLTEHLPIAYRLRLDDGFNVKDIDAFIDEQISRNSGCGQLLSDNSLRTEVKKTLKEKANGM